jgi:deoxyribose-phosphate aldolase
MTDHQLEELVARIGDEMLSRLGVPGTSLAPGTPAPLGVGCGCGFDPEPRPNSALPSGWTARLIELDCRSARLTAAEVSAQCLQARNLELGAVNVLPGHVVAAGRSLRGAATRIVASVGWPHGTTSTGAKALEAELALGQGADEIEVPVSPGLLLASEDDQIYGELRLIAELVHGAGKMMTATIESTGIDQSRLITAGALTRLARVDVLCAAVGSTHHGSVGLDAVELFVKVAGDDMRVKASGGVDSGSVALTLVGAGASVVTVSSLVVATSLASADADVR